MMENERDAFETQDLNVAAAVWVAGGDFVSAEPQSHRSLKFVFRPHARCRCAADDFLRGALIVNARDFTDKQRALKDVLFAKLRDRENGDGDQRWKRPTSPTP